MASTCAVLGGAALAISDWPMPVARAIAPEPPNTALLSLGCLDARQLLWHALIGAYVRNERVLRRKLQASRLGLALVGLAAAALLAGLAWPGAWVADQVRLCHRTAGTCLDPRPPPI